MDKESYRPIEVSVEHLDPREDQRHILALNDHKCMCCRAMIDIKIIHVDYMLL